jgi:hypothetical protein
MEMVKKSCCAGKIAISSKNVWGRIGAKVKGHGR